MKKGWGHNNALSVIKLAFLGLSTRRFVLDFSRLEILVLAVWRPIIVTHRTKNKFVSKWDGPYVVQEAYTNGAYKLIAEDGLRIGPINGKFLKRYYA